MPVDGASVVGSNTGCITTLKDTGDINAYYDPASDLITMIATLKNGSYAGWGWGGSMTDTEMVIFSANGAQSGVSTVYGVGKSEPENDPAMIACYDTNFFED